MVQNEGFKELPTASVSQRTLEFNSHSGTPINSAKEKQRLDETSCSFPLRAAARWWCEKEGDVPERSGVQGFGQDALRPSLHPRFRGSRDGCPALRDNRDSAATAWAPRSSRLLPAVAAGNRALPKKLLLARTSPRPDPKLSPKANQPSPASLMHLWEQGWLLSTGGGSPVLPSFRRCSPVVSDGSARVPQRHPSQMCSGQE